jgi:hypothetical protein
MGGGEFLQGLHISEFRHRSFLPSERLVGILGSIVEPPTADLIGRIADYLHRRSVRSKPVGYQFIQIQQSSFFVPYNSFPGLISGIGNVSIGDL